MEELIIHPRIQTDFYKNTPNLEMFEYAVKNSKNPLCYNGDICTKEEYEIICNRFQEVPSVMIGRGILKIRGWFGRSDKAYRLKKTGSGHFMMNFTGNIRKFFLGRKRYSSR